MRGCWVIGALGTLALTHVVVLSERSHQRTLCRVDSGGNVCQSKSPVTMTAVFLSIPYMSRTHSAALGNVWTPGAAQDIDMHYDFPIDTDRKKML